MSWRASSPKDALNNSEHPLFLLLFFLLFLALQYSFIGGGSMARVTVEDCIRFYPNRFEMAHLAARRARQLLEGMPCLLEAEGDKPSVEALRELGEGLVSWDSLFEMDEQNRRRKAACAAAADAEAGAV